MKKNIDQIKNTVINVMEGLVNKTSQARDRESVEKLFTGHLRKKERQHIKFKYFKNGIVNVDVDSSVWLYSFALRKDDLLSKLNSKAGMIKDIRFRIGDVK